MVNEDAVLVVRRTIANTLFYGTPAAAEAIVKTLRSLGWGPVAEARDKALEDAARVCDPQEKWDDPLTAYSIAAAIRALKEKQP